MKKLLIFGVAAISFAACVQEQVVETPQGNPIAFADAFIDNATRAAVDPSTTVDDLTGFDVWGFVKEYDGTVFADQDVTLQGSGWTYQGTQFWAPEQPYYFAALAPMNSANVKETLATGEAAKLGLGTVEFTNVDGSEDLLYAACKVTSKKMGQANDPVKFQFKHLLSKVKFTFKNGFLTDNAYVEVKNVKMTAPAAASIDLAQENYSKAWNLGAEKVTLAFGDVQKLSYLLDGEAAAERLTIPASSSHSYTVTFDLVLYMGNQPVYETSKTSTVTGVELEMGKAYNFAAEINPDNLELDSIQFDVVEIDEWIPAGPSSDLLVAAQFGGTITLNEDVVLTENLVFTANTTLNLNGHTITGGKTYAAGMSGADISALTVDKGAELTIIGPGTITGSEYGAYVKEGSLTIKDGEFTAGTSAVQVNYGTVNIEGGKFSSGDDRYTVNCIDARYKDGSAVVNIIGGSFYKFNPADNKSEGAGTDYVPAGYSSVADGDYFVVVPGSEITTLIDEAEEVLTTFAIPNAVIYMEEGNYLLEKKMSIASGVTLYGNGSSIKNDWSSLAFNTQTTLKNVTVEDMNFTNNTVFDMAYAEGELSFSNCVFSHVRGNQSIHLDGKPGAKVVFDNCTFYGRNMYASSLGKVVFNNCKFLESTWNTEQGKKGVGTGWSGVNMWGKYEFNNCQFDKACVCNVKTNGVEAEFNNCSFTDGDDIAAVVRNPSNYTAVINIH